MLQASFFIPGPPIAQGSMRQARGKIFHANKDLATWRARVGHCAKIAISKPMKNKALKINYTFYVLRPPSVRRPLPNVRPDLDKYIRAINDGLEQEGKVIDEDSRITDISARKRYVDRVEECGAFISIHTIKDNQKKVKNS